MRLHDEIWINASPERVYAFFEAMDHDNYLRWHPDHKLFRWEQGQGLQEGVVCYFEEVIGGKLLAKRVYYSRIEPGRYIEFKPSNWLFRLFLPRLSFRIEPEPDGGSRFTAEIHLRIGPLAAWLNRRELDAVRQHMREEGENLKRLVEQETQA